MLFEKELTHAEFLASLPRLAEAAISRYALPSGIDATLINISENATFRLDHAATGQRWALRIHRVGYHSERGIASELAWLAGLREARCALVPEPIPGRDGNLIQTVTSEGLLMPRHVVLFAWEPGVEPAADDIKGFELMGEAAARMHRHVQSWPRPSWFERHTWDFETSIGARPHWGRWRDGLGMRPEIEAAIAEATATVERRLATFGKDPSRFNLVHGDMRLANLLMHDGAVKVIDFDDCGFSWLLYDCATTVSFFEERPEVPDLLSAWVRGYRRVTPLTAEEEREIETFVLLRRILLIAWIGSHAETDLAQTMGVAYTEAALPMCERYLSRFATKRSEARP